MDKIGTYQIVEIIHRGPQPLFRARAKDGREVAIKAIPVDGLSAEMRERFTREALTCLNLSHPNLIRVYEMGESDGMLFQAMEMLEGSDLGKVMGEGRGLDWAAKLSIMEQVADGLQFAHEHHLVHRDIKPANLFLENSGRVKVLDFGMVRVAESELTKAGSSLGTLNYMAPEQIRGERCTTATDVFSAGIVFFQLATGRHPFSARDRSLMQVVSAIVFETPPKLTELAPDAPEGLEFILERALEKDARKRLQNAGDLKQSIALCRMAVQLNPAPAAASADETKVLPRAVAEPVVEKPRGPAPVQAAGGGEDKTIVMRAAMPPAAKDVEKTKVMKQYPSPKADSAPEEKTKVMPRSAPPAVPSSGVGSDTGEKTKVMQRMASSPAPVPGVKPAAKQAAKAESKPRAAAHAARYCPACTFANPPDAAVCQRCQTPLAGGAAAAGAAGAKPSSTPLYVAIGVAVLLAIALVVVLVLK